MARLRGGLRFGFLIFGLSLYGSSTLFAYDFPSSVTTAEAKGRHIAEISVQRDEGWKDMSVIMQMILRDTAGRESKRDMRLISLEVANDGDKSLSVFDTPPDIKGTAFLTYSHIKKADDQWIFLPALRRVKRIASKNKSGPFLGSTFAFEDLSSFEVDKYRYKYLREERDPTLGMLFVSELYPEYPHSGYSKVISYLDQEHFRVQKIEYFDRKGDLLKTQNYHDYKLYNDKFWRADRTTMINHQSGKSTEMLWKNYQFGTGLTDRDFNKNGLKRFQ